MDTYIPFIRNAMPSAEKLTFLSSIAITYFVLGDYKAADEMLYEIKEINHKTKRMDIIYFSNLFHLLVIYELGDTYRLSNNLQSTYNYLYNKKQLKSFEKNMILFMKKQVNFINRPKQSEELEKILLTLEQYLNEPVTKTYFLYFNYHAWVLSKLNKISYREQVKLNLQANRAIAV